MDEYIGKERLRCRASCSKSFGKALVVQLTMLFRLPFWIHIETADGDGFTTLTHRIEAGIPWRGKDLDPLLRGLFVRTHAAAMDEHARVEFPKLRDMLLSKEGRGRSAR